MSRAGVIRTEDHEPPRQIRQAVKRGGDVTAVHESRVRNDRADESFLRDRHEIRGEAFFDLSAQPGGAPFVETSGDGGQARVHSAQSTASDYASETKMPRHTLPRHSETGSDFEVSSPLRPPLWVI